MLGEEGIGIDVGEHREALFDQLFGGFEGADGVRQQMSAVWNHLQLHEGVVFLAGQLGQLPAQPGHPDGFFGGGTAGCVGQHPDPLPVDGFQEAFMARCLALHPAHGHGDDLAATGGQAGLHAGEAGVFPRASHQSTLKAAAPNH